MTFFLSPTELEEMNDKVAKAVNDAVDYVLSREQSPTTSTDPEIPQETAG
jgi:hypothetical protein